MRKMETVMVEGSPLNFREAASTASGVLCRSGSFNSTLRPSRIISHHSSSLNIPLRDLPSVHHQPPLLPLPSPRFASGYYPRKVRPRGNLQKMKPSASVVPVDPDGITIPPAQRVLTAKEPLEGTEDEEYLESVYSKSPPPSSLPLPRFALMRPAKGGRTDSEAHISDDEKAPGAAAAGTSGGLDAGATQDIRRLLRL